MNRNKFIKRSSLTVFVLAMCFASFASAQQPLPAAGGPRPMTVAGRNNLYCAGYVQTSPIKTENKIVGGLEEQERFNYVQNDVVYVNMGTSKGLDVGDMLAVVRPRGQVDTRWTRKGDLGFLVQEVGALEVIRVKGDVSVARVKTSCDTFLLGDLVQPVQQRASPMHQGRGPLDQFTDGTDKPTGRLFMARHGAEMVTRDQIVYIDLGAEDKVRVGDYLTIFRPLGKGNLFENANEDRPAIRKVVGEMVVLNVKERTATAVITRTAQEIHTGDWVQLQ